MISRIDSKRDSSKWSVAKPGELGQGYKIFDDIRTKYPRVPVIILCVFTDLTHATRAISQGARGYINDSISGTNIADAIRCVLAGEMWFDEEFVCDDVGDSDNNQYRNQIPNLDYS